MWIYLRARSSDPTRAAALDNLLNWSYSDGQMLADQDG